MKIRFQSLLSKFNVVFRYGAAALDMRFSSSSVSSFASSSYPAAAVLWSDIMHESECRSVDLCQAGKWLLTAGFDGACVVVGAEVGL